MKTTQFLFPALLVTLVFAGAGRQSQASTILFTDSSQLDMSGNVLAAVDFAFNNNTNPPYFQMTGYTGANVANGGPIQGVLFDILAVNNVGDVTNYALNTGDGTLTTNLSATGYDGRKGAITAIAGTDQAGPGNDQAEAWGLANNFTFLGSGSLDLNFAFGAFINQTVQVQFVGHDGGTLAGNWIGTWEVRVNGNVTAVDSSYTATDDQKPRLTTFLTSTDGSGNLNLNFKAVGGLAGLAGIVVTAVPEPSSAALLGVGAAAMVGLRRRRQG